MIYAVDTSSLLAAWNERYPLRNAPGFWTRFEEGIEAGKLVSPIEVRNEIKKKEDGLADWLKDRADFFIDLEEDIQVAAREILREFPWLTKGIAGRKVADPFVIALAKARGHTVVSEEGPGNEKRPKIPYVCRHYDVSCVNVLGLIQGEDWIL